MDMLRRPLARLARTGTAVSLSVLMLALCLTLSRPAHAMKIQEVTSPGGIKAWLVEAHENPLLALRFSFEGGNSQDPEGKEGVANFLSAMLDEGAGDIKASDFQEQM
jgi:zinc protease